MKKVVSQRKDIAFYIKLFPLPMHKDAYWKSKTVMCENSLALLDDVMDKKQIPQPKCETTVIDDNMKLADRLGITGTPTIVFPNGNIAGGFMDAESIIKVVDRIEQEKK